MTRTLSAKARAERNAETREQYPHLEEQLDAFRDNKFAAEEVMAVIKHLKAGESMPGKTAEKFSALEDDAKAAVSAAAENICDGYAEFYEARRSSGVDLKAPDALAALEEDITKICNFSGGTPHFKPRQAIEGYLNQQEQSLDTDKAAEKDGHAEEEAQRTGISKADAKKLGMAAGAIAGVTAAAEASKQWRDRVKKPDARKKAVAFASVAAISAVGIAASLFLGRHNGGVGR